MAWLLAVPVSAGPAVAKWGNNVNNYHGIPIPPDLTEVAAIAAGHYHSLALKPDGTVTGWGSPDTFVAPPTNLRGVKAISAGYRHNLALRNDGTVVAWGDGDGSGTGSYALGQSQVPSDLKGVVAIAAGAFHSLALKDDGTVVAWGAGKSAATGPFQFGQSAVPAGLSGVAAIAAGYYLSMALKADGTVVMWGIAPGPSPASVPSDLRGVVGISAGASHAVALKADGTVMSWGWGIEAAGLTNVPPGLNNVVAVAAGHRLNVALRGDGSIVQWPTPAGGGTFWPPAATGVEAIAVGAEYALVSGPKVAISPQIGRTLAPTEPVAQGSQATLEVQAQCGTPIMQYQWRFNGLPIAGATEKVMRIDAVQLHHEGNYSVLVSNRLGVAESGLLKLRVVSANDAFETPLAIPSVGGRSLSATPRATREPDEPYHAGVGSGGSLWFLWHAPVNGAVTIDTVGSGFDTVLAVYTGESLSSLKLVAADDDGAHFRGASRLDFDAVGGTAYRIAVGTFGGSATEMAVVLNLFLQEPVLAISHLLGGRRLGLGVGGVPGTRVFIQASEDLVRWYPVGTNVVPETGTVWFGEQDSLTQCMRFFRAIRSP